MSYVKVVTALSLIKALNEAQSIFNTGNRSYDGDAKAGASSVDIDAMPLLTAKATGSSSVHADRKGPGDTTKVNIPLVPSIVPVKEKKIDQFSTNGRMAADFIAGARDAHSDYFDAAFIAAMDDTDPAYISDFGAEVLEFKDLTDMDAALTGRKVPRRNRFGIVDAQLESVFNNIDVVKRAMAYNPNYLENGIIKIKGVTWIVTANAPEVNGKPAIREYFGPGVTFILNQFMDTERVYDPENVQVNIDFIAYYGAKLLKDAFVEIKTMP